MILKAPNWDLGSDFSSRVFTDQKGHINGQCSNGGITLPMLLVLFNFNYLMKISLWCFFFYLGKLLILKYAWAEAKHSTLSWLHRVTLAFIILQKQFGHHILGGPMWHIRKERERWKVKPAYQCKLLIGLCLLWSGMTLIEALFNYLSFIFFFNR